MGCYKLENDRILFVCPCGYESNFVLAELKYDFCTIYLPQCKNCERSNSLFVNEIPEEIEATIPAAILQRNRMNQTLLKRMRDQGKGPEFDRDVPKKSDFFRLAVDDNVKILDAPLHPEIALAREKLLDS